MQMSSTSLAPVLRVARTVFIDARTMPVRTFMSYRDARTRTSPSLLTRTRTSPVLHARTFLGWFDAAFNKYDEARVKEVGADRAAAEWLLRCGAGEVGWGCGCRWGCTGVP